jgi:hypothetical protein
LEGFASRFRPSRARGVALPSVPLVGCDLVPKNDREAQRMTQPDVRRNEGSPSSERGPASRTLLLAAWGLFLVVVLAALLV